MAAPKTEINPFIRRSIFQRVKDALRYVLRLPRQIYTGYRNWPKGFRQLFTLLGVAALLFGAYAGGMFWYKRSKDKDVMSAKIALNETIVKQESKEKVLEAANKVLAIDPDEVQTLERKKAIETGVGDPKDKDVMMYLFRTHLQAKDFDALEREAIRRLDYEKRDYYAHYLLTSIYLDRIQKNDPRKEESSKKVMEHLEALGNPEANAVNLNFHSVSASLQTLKELRRDVTRLKLFIAERIVPIVKSQGAQDFEPDAQSMMLFLFCETFDLPKLPNETGLTWPFAEALAQKSLDGALAKGDLNTLRNLAALGPNGAAGLTAMRNANQISEAQRVEYAAAHEQRTQRALKEIIAKDPKNAVAYFGLVQSYARSGQGNEAAAALQTGMENCGDNPQLLQIFSNLTIMNDREMLGYKTAKAAAERNPGMPLYWVLAARAAEKIDRRDWAFEALENALAEVPRMPDVGVRKATQQEIMVMLAALSSNTGHPEKVLAALAGLPDPELVYMPQACHFLARALAEIGDTERLEAFLELAAETSNKANSPQPAYFAALGATEALPQTVERITKTAEYLDPLIRKWRIEFPPLLQLHAYCLVKAAQLAPGPLDPVAARRAINACESALALDPNHLPTATNLLLFRLRGDKDPGKARTEIDPLLANINKLTPEQAEVLGMVYIANKQYDDGLRVLKPYTAGRATAGCWIQTALAYHGQGRADEAETALRNASQLPMSDRERSDYANARDLLSRVKQ